MKFNFTLRIENIGTLVDVKHLLAHQAEVFNKVSDQPRRQKAIAEALTQLSVQMENGIENYYDDI